MLNGIENLPALPAEAWSSVRDISLSIVEAGTSQSGRYVADIQSAICYTGTAQAYRLCSTDQPETVMRVLDLVDRIDPALIRNRRRFRLEQEGLSFRVQVGINAENRDIQMRVLPAQAPSLNDLLIPPAWHALMMDPALLTGGLVLLTSPNGQGKTTTASALVRSRLQAFGGMANTVEDPIELPLQGVWGRGVCFQRPADLADRANLQGNERPGEGYSLAMIDALRQFPAITGGGTMLFVGEIRDAMTAAETIKAASNGHLVIATMHAKSVLTGIRRLMTLASDSVDGLDAENMRQMLSDCLRVVFNQRLIWSLSGKGWTAANVTGQALASPGYRSEVAQIIRSGDLARLSGLTQQQADIIAAYETFDPNTADALRNDLHSASTSA